MHSHPTPVFSAIILFERWRRWTEAEGMDDILSMSVTELGISTRAKHSLNNPGSHGFFAVIKTVGELVSITERDLMLRPNMGAKTLRKIKEQLAKHGLQLAEDHCFDELGLSSHAKGCLVGSDPQIGTTDQLMMFTEEDLLKRRGLGKGALREIKDKLRQHGLKLKSEVQPIKPFEPVLESTIPSSTHPSRPGAET
jgi:DNA-directed RNA polymerase alpha subunit